VPGCACAAAPKAPPVVWPKGDAFCWVAPNGELVCPNADVVVDPNAEGAAAGAPNKPVALDGCVAPKALVVVDPKAPVVCPKPPGVAGEPKRPPGAGAGAPNGVLAGAPKALVCPKPPGVWGDPNVGALVVWPNALVCCCGGKPPKAFVVVDAPNVGWLGVPKAPNDMAASLCERCALCYPGAAIRCAGAL
jgi:hypothetical protein